MWLSAIKLAVSAGSKIYANKQRTKMAMSDAQLMHATKMARRSGSLPGKTFRSSTIGLERRGRFDNFKFARVGAGLGSRIGRSDSDGQSKIVLRDVFAAPVMVHKSLDLGSGFDIWYKRNSNF